MSISSSNSDIGALKLALKSLYGGERDDLAARLLERFGDVRGVFTATPHELCEIGGVTERAAMFFNMLLPLERQAVLRGIPDTELANRGAVENFLHAYFFAEMPPACVCVELDACAKIVNILKCSASFEPNELVTELCRSGAERYILASYVDGRDKRSAKRQCEIARLKEITDVLGIEFAGHITIAGRATGSNVDGSAVTENVTANTEKMRA